MTLVSTNASVIAKAMRKKPAPNQIDLELSVHGKKKNKVVIVLASQTKIRRSELVSTLMRLAARLSTGAV